MILSNCDISSYYIKFYNEVAGKLLCHHLAVCLGGGGFLGLAGTGSRYIFLWAVFLYLRWLSAGGDKTGGDSFNGRHTWKIPLLGKFCYRIIFLLFRGSLCIWLRSGLEWLWGICPRGVIVRSSLHNQHLHTSDFVHYHSTCGD